MAKGKRKMDTKEKTEDKGTEAAPTEAPRTPEVKGTRYVCVSPHDEPRGPGCHIKRTAGEVDTFTKDPGPCWRREDEIKQTKEVPQDD